MDDGADELVKPAICSANENVAVSVGIGLADVS
jgi:hypothetical protein